MADRVKQRNCFSHIFLRQNGIAKINVNCFASIVFGFIGCSENGTGKSNGKGYYIFEKGSKPKPDYTVQPIVEESRRITNLVENVSHKFLFTVYSYPPLQGHVYVSTELLFVLIKKVNINVILSPFP